MWEAFLFKKKKSLKKKTSKQKFSSFAEDFFILLSEFPERGIYMRNYFQKYFSITKSQHE